MNGIRAVSKKRAAENRKRKKVTDAMKRAGPVLCQFEEPIDEVRVYRAARHRYNVSEGGRDETDELNELEQQRNAAFGIARRVLAGKEAQGG